MRIYLRPVTLEDGANIVKWRNTPSVSAHCLNQTPITIESNEAFFHANIETGYYQDGICQGYFLPQNTKINALVLLIRF